MWPGTTYWTKRSLLVRTKRVNKEIKKKKKTILLQSEQRKQYVSCLWYSTNPPACYINISLRRLWRYPGCCPHPNSSYIPTLAPDEALHCALRQTSIHRTVPMSLRVPNTPSRQQQELPTSCPEKGIWLGESDAEGVGLLGKRERC